MLKSHNWRTYYYGNFAPEDGGGRESSRVDPANPGNITWRTFDHRPRFGNNYAGLRNRIAILSEAYSYLDFKGRVEVTEDFVEEIYKSVAGQRQADHDADRAGRSRRSRRRRTASPSSSASTSRFARCPSKVEILVGDVTKVPNPRSGREMLAMAPMAVPVSMKDYGVFAATRSLPMPKGWVIPKTLVDSAAPGRRARSPALARHQDPGIRRTTSSWRWSGSRSPRSPRRRGRSRATRKRA